MESAKECVTTHLPNRIALKMDGAGASGPYLAIAGSQRGARGMGAPEGGHPSPHRIPADARPQGVGGLLR